MRHFREVCIDIYEANSISMKDFSLSLLFASGFVIRSSFILFFYVSALEKNPFVLSHECVCVCAWKILRIHKAQNFIDCIIEEDSFKY